jgi:hypothetical protein
MDGGTEDDRWGSIDLYDRSDDGQGGTQEHNTTKRKVSKKKKKQLGEIRLDRPTARCACAPAMIDD